MAVNPKFQYGQPVVPPIAPSASPFAKLGQGLLNSQQMVAERIKPVQSPAASGPQPGFGGFSFPTQQNANPPQTATASFSPQDPNAYLNQAKAFSEANRLAAVNALAPTFQQGREALESRVFRQGIAGSGIEEALNQKQQRLESEAINQATLEANAQGQQAQLQAMGMGQQAWQTNLEFQYNQDKLAIDRALSQGQISAWEAEAADREAKNELVSVEQITQLANAMFPMGGEDARLFVREQLRTRLGWNDQKIGSMGLADWGMFQPTPPNVQQGAGGQSTSSPPGAPSAPGSFIGEVSGGIGGRFQWNGNRWVAMSGTGLSGLMGG